ncbi:hypothetical protein DL767_002615 [Monosporascus sp. MG133]|nr:hypothetical protein DL767_002615 [Monosporascus sp. MG133]
MVRVDVEQSCLLENESTLTVAAGSEMGFGIDETSRHPGPQQAYLPRVPAGVTAMDCDGSGGWTRMYAAGTLANSSWAEPEDLSWGQAQFYTSCTQLRVTGNGTRMLGPLVNFPGTYTPTNPGVLIPGFWTYIKNYTPPGPALWPPGMKDTHVVKTFPPLEEEKDNE